MNSTITKLIHEAETMLMTYESCSDSHIVMLIKLMIEVLHTVSDSCTYTEEDDDTDIKVEPFTKEDMDWRPWSEKSNAIPFESSVTGVGDGEGKVAAELDTVILGQNSPYDMAPVLNGVQTQCDVKKLDTQNDFNTGKKGRDALRPVKTRHTHLLHSLNTIADGSVFTSDEKARLAYFHDVSPDELAVGTLRRLHDVCVMLSAKKRDLRSTLPSVPFTVQSRTHDMPLDLYYSVCMSMGLVFPDEFSPFMETILILQQLNHVYIDTPDAFWNDLNALVAEIFTDTTLIIVDKTNGYAVLEDISKVQFYRITRGNPRFKIIV